MLMAKGVKNIADVPEIVEVLGDNHLFNEFSETKSSVFLKKVIAAQQSSVEMSILKKTWRKMNGTPKTMKIIRFERTSSVFGRGKN